MNKINNVYKCNVCGNMVEMTHASGGELVCCGKSMNLLTENTTEAAVEKHIPVVEKNGNNLSIKVGSVAHPMDETHFIEWIEVLTEDIVYRKNLRPGQNPSSEFVIDSDKFSVRAYCNLHGLWKAE